MPLYLLFQGFDLKRRAHPPIDLEWILLIKIQEHIHYFETLVTFLELQVLSIGETPCDHTPLFTSSPSQEGFHWDTGGGTCLIGTPENIAKAHLHLTIEPRSLSYTIHHLSRLHGNKGLFEDFLTFKNLCMPRDLQQIGACSLLKQRQEDFYNHRKILDNAMCKFS